MKTPGTDGKVRSAAMVRYQNCAPSSATDLLTVEEPLEIRIHGEPLAVTMRTPGNDHELTLGLLFAEGLVSSVRDVGSVAHCGRPGSVEYGNAIDVTAAPGTTLDATRARRGTLTTSACGVCGRQSIDDLLARCRPLRDESRLSTRVVENLVATLGAAQAAFAETGGIHAAGIAALDGGLVVAREDVGRHNAVDKVVGRLLLDGALPASGRVLVVSGRSSFEIVQKAVVAGIPFVVSVSAPSTLAVETAERGGVTLIGFARGETFNVYAHAWRVTG